MEVFFWDAVHTDDGRDCSAVIDVRICFRGASIESIRRDVGREWQLEAHHSSGTLFLDRVSGDRFRSEGFTGEVEAVELETHPTDGGRLSLEDDVLRVWNGTDFELAMLPGRVITAGVDGDEVEALVEPGVVWRGKPTPWDMLRWNETHFAPGGTAVLRGAELSRSLDAARRVQERVNDMLRDGELELRRRSAERRRPELDDPTWSWSSAPPRPELVLDGVLPPFGFPRHASLEWEVGASGFGLVRQGYRDFGRAVQVEWMGLDRVGRSFVTTGENPARLVREYAQVVAAHPGWVLRVEFVDDEPFDDQHECDLVLIRASAEPYRRRWHRCSLDTLGALSLPLDAGRTGVMVHAGSHRHLLEVDSRGHLLGERSILGPQDHRDEWIQEVEGRLAHVVASGRRAKAHFIDGEDRRIQKLRPPSGACSEDRGGLLAASHLSPRMNLDGSTNDRFPQRRLWRAYWIASSSSGTCVRAGFELYPPLAWWADGSGIRGMRWDARHGPASMHEGVEADGLHGYSAIEARGTELFVLLPGEGSVRLLRVDGEAVEEVVVPAELADSEHRPRLGPGGVLHTGTHGWAPGENVYAVPDGFLLLDAMKGRGKTYFLRRSPEGEVVVVDGNGAPRVGDALDPEIRHAFAPSRAEPRVVSGDGERSLVAGRSGSPGFGMLMRSTHLPSAESCARVEVLGSRTLTPPIGCRDSAFAVSADERLVAYHGRVVGAKNPSHVRIARRVGTRWVEWGTPIEVQDPLSGVWVDGALHVVTNDGGRWLLRSFRRGRWSTRALEPTAGPD